MQIIVRHQGGLGNQLFQYAAGRYFAKKYSGSLRIAIELPDRLFSHGEARPFQLPQFNIKASFSQINNTERLLRGGSPKKIFAAKLVRSFRHIQIIRQRQTQFLFGPEPRIAANTRIVYLDGCWQCYPHVQAVEDELRGELSLREDLKGKNLEVANTIRAAEQPVSLHVRRGDYATVFPTDVLPLEYYRDAMQQMRQRLSNRTFFIFSDEPQFARALAADALDCILVDHNDPHSAYEDLRLMSICKHHIIANSTFSWWGAWLNPRKNKIVFMPKRWVLVNTNETELALPDWNLV